MILFQLSSDGLPEQNSLHPDRLAPRDGVPEVGMLELLLHVVVELFQIDLKGVVLQVVVQLEIVMGQDALVDEPDGKGVAEDRPKLLHQVQRQGGPAVSVCVQDSKEGVQIVLPKSTKNFVLHHGVGEREQCVDMVLRGPTGSALEAPAVRKAAVDEVEVDLCSLALNPPQLIESAGPCCASFKLRQLSHIGYAFTVNKCARVPDLCSDDPLGYGQALLFRKSVLAAAHFSDGVPLRDDWIFFSRTLYTFSIDSPETSAFCIPFDKYTQPS